MKSIEAISTPPVLGDEGSFGPAGRRGDIFRYDQTNLTGMVRLKSIRNGGGQRSFFDESGNITRPGTPKVSESKQPETDSVGDYFEKIVYPKVTKTTLGPPRPQLGKSFSLAQTIL